MELPEGASVSIEEIKKVSDALAELEKDPHAPRELDIHVTIHIRNEYPKMLYKGTGKSTPLSVASSDEEQKARDNGYGDYVHDPDEVSVGV